METMHSTVKWFDAKKGYGFIDHPEGGGDVFVHYSQIESEADFKTLRTGQDVTFELKDGPKGLHATTVVPEEDDEAPHEAPSAGRSHSDTAPQSTPAHAAQPAAQPSEHRPSHTLSSPYAEAAEAAEESSRQEAETQSASARAEDAAADEQRASYH